MAVPSAAMRVLLRALPLFVLLGCPSAHDPMLYPPEEEPDIDAGAEARVRDIDAGIDAAVRDAEVPFDAFMPRP